MSKTHMTKAQWEQEKIEKLAQFAVIGAVLWMMFFGMAGFGVGCIAYGFVKAIGIGIGIVSGLVAMVISYCWLVISQGRALKAERATMMFSDQEYEADVTTS